MRKGFTLIELLAVIVVLAIIALITIPAVLRITENAKISSYRRSIDLYGRAINTAVMAYKSDMVEKKQPINVNFDNVIPYVDYEGYDISCEISKIYSDDTVLLTKCSIEKDIVYAEKVKGFGIENYYYYTNSKKRIKALLYVEAVNKSLQGKNVGTTCEVTSEGNVRCNNQTIEITGELGNPKSGTLYIENNQVTRYSNLKFEDEKAQTQQEVAQVVDEQQINTNPNNDNNNNQNNNGNNNQNNQENNNNNNNQQNNNTPKYATLVEDKNGNGEPDRGDKYTYKVNATDTFTFYVLSIEGTGENQKVNLIMDRNICNDGTVEYTSANYYCKYAWESNNVNVNGPITAMTALGNGTRNWDNVSNMNLNYSDEGHESNSSYGYTGMTITNGTGYITTKDGIQTSITLTDNKPIKSRLPKFSEIYKEQDDDYCNSNRGSCPAWLVKNLCYNERGFNSWCTTCKTKYIENKTNGITNIYGYWLLSSDPGNSNDARSVYYSGYVFNDNPAQASNYGLRPVITVSLSDLS